MMSSQPDTRRREELLDQVQSLILVEGFAQLRVGALAAHLSCSRSTLYKLAPSKDELIALVFRAIRRQGAHRGQTEAEPSWSRRRSASYASPRSSPLAGEGIGGVLARRLSHPQAATC
jgi:AcrR family transcriptional regulator